VSRRLDPSTLRAALWTLRALRRARRQLRETGLEDLSLPRLPSLPASAERGVQAVLRRRDHTCLERAVVLQHWRAAHGEPRDIIVGVAGTADAFRAHAWLEDEADGQDLEAYRELRRVRL
jgi:hypothetical protein